MRVPVSSAMTLDLDRFGPDTAPPVVLLHGLSGGRRTYDDVVAHLTAPGGIVHRGSAQLLVVDLRGHGGSGRAEPGAYDAPSYAADIVGLLELVAAGPAVIVGHSLGGVVAAHVAATRPDLVRAVLLEDPPLYEGDAERRAASPAAQFFPAVVAAVRDLQAAGAPPDAFRPLAEARGRVDHLEQRCATLHAWDPETMQAALDGIVWQGYDPSARLACPVTVLAADPEVGAVFSPADAASFAAANPHASIVTVTGADHSIHEGMPAAYLAHLDAVLAGALDGGSPAAG